MQTDSITVYSRALEYTVEDDEDELQDYKDEIATAEKDFDSQYESLLSVGSSTTDPLQKQDFDLIKADWLDFAAQSTNVIALVDKKSDEETISDARETLELSQEKFSATVDSMLEDEQAQNQVLQERVQATLQSSLVLIIVGFSVAAIFSVSLGTIIAGRFSKAIIDLRNAVDGLVRGKYDIQISKNHAPAEELEELQLHFNEVRNQLQEREKMQREFLMIASHELRTPIQPILACASLAQKKTIPAEKALDIIHREAERLKRLADDILDATKLESGRMKYAMEDFPLAPLIREITEEVRTSNTLRPNVSILADVKIDNSCIVFGDKERLSQAVWNILNNALRFTTEGSIQLSCDTVKEKYSNGPEQTFVELLIMDTGPGIPDALLPNLFKKFVSMDINGESKHGTGLGLFISKSIIEAHGGKISAIRRDVRGTTFSILLPAKGFAEHKNSDRHTLSIENAGQSERVHYRQEAA